MGSLKFSDEQLKYLSRNFNEPDWAILEFMCWDDPESENPQLLPFHETRELIMSELNKNIQLAVNAFRHHIALLDGAGAIELDAGFRDARAKLVRVTPEGYRMLQMYLYENEG